MCCGAASARFHSWDATNPGCWIGAFTQVALQGGFSQSPKAYAAMIRRYAWTGLIDASTQAVMCDPGALKATGLDISGHQRLTIERLGRELDDYRPRLDAYADRIGHGAGVGVGSLCKRLGRAAVIAAILDAILGDRPDLRLHGFGCKRTAFLVPDVRRRLATADSMAWSYAARFEGRDQNAWDEAGRFALAVGGCPEAVERLAAKAGWRGAVGRDVDAPQRGGGAALWLQ